ncbi:DUF707 domain-containing protein [Caldimonas taiwanensis]|uniref:DUF707 domain-containing protein n=2 Tax=Sphaerotilaceae TaxID=2975441 RepID=UPI0012FAE212|nr:DUF707 domain-containing protein [Caldimonas taiwanensis]
MSVLVAFRLDMTPNLTYRRKNLVILRAGDDSLHDGWIAQPERDFDLFISYYGTTPGRHQASADYYETRRGPKWPCIGELLEQNPDLVNRYDAFWFPDDDIAATTDTLNRMFALFHGFGLSLAQPALTRDSYYTWDTLLQQPDYLLRFCRFVEVMVPIFDRAALKACMHTFSESRSGWGLDWVWPELCGKGRPDSIAVIDATPVRHTRPLGGNLYKNNPDLDPRADERRILEKYQLTEHRYFSKYAFAAGAIAKVRLPWHQRFWLQLRRLNAKRRLHRQTKK